MLRLTTSPIGFYLQRDTTTLYAQTSIDCLALTFVGMEGAIVQLYLAHRATLFMRKSNWRFLYWALVIVGVLVGLAGQSGPCGSPANASVPSPDAPRPCCLQVRSCIS